MGLLKNQESLNLPCKDDRERIGMTDSFFMRILSGCFLKRPVMSVVISCVSLSSLASALRETVVEETIGRILRKELMSSLNVINHISLFHNVRIKLGNVL